MATAKKRGKTWTYSISYKKTDGTYSKLRKGGFRTKAEALSAANLIEIQIKQGHDPLKKQMLFYDYFENWIELYKKPAVDIQTYRKYLTTLNNIEKYLPDKTLEEITREVYQKAINEFAETHAKNTTRVFHTHLKACLLDAFEEKVILTNPTRKAIISGQVPEQAEDEKYLEYDDAQRFYNETKSRLGRHTSHYVIIIIAYTGARLGEVLGLTWDNIEFDKETIKIEKTWKYKEKEPHFGPTKNHERRTIFMPEQLADILKTYREYQEEKGILIDRVVPGKISSNAVNKTMRNIQDYLDIDPKITAHGLRHTHASILIMNDINILTVSERLGHKDVSITQNTYTHLLNALKEKDLPKLRESLTF